jgi:hypothetical protein
MTLPARTADAEQPGAAVRQHRPQPGIASPPNTTAVSALANLPRLA